MAISVERRRDPLTYVGMALLIAGLLAAGVVVFRIILVQGDWGLQDGFLHSVRHAGFVLTTPFHGLINLQKWKPQELVNDALAAAVFFFAGLLLWRLLR